MRRCRSFPARHWQEARLLHVEGASGAPIFPKPQQPENLRALENLHMRDEDIVKNKYAYDKVDTRLRQYEARLRELQALAGPRPDVSGEIQAQLERGDLAAYGKLSSAVRTKFESKPIRLVDNAGKQFWIAFQNGGTNLRIHDPRTNSWVTPSRPQDIRAHILRTNAASLVSMEKAENSADAQWQARKNLIRKAWVNGNSEYGQNYQTYDQSVIDKMSKGEVPASRPPLVTRYYFDVVRMEQHYAEVEAMISRLEQQLSDKNMSIGKPLAQTLAEQRTDALQAQIDAEDDGAKLRTIHLDRYTQAFREQARTPENRAVRYHLLRLPQGARAEFIDAKGMGVRVDQQTVTLSGSAQYLKINNTDQVTEGTRLRLTYASKDKSVKTVTASIAKDPFGNLIFTFDPAALPMPKAEDPEEVPEEKPNTVPASPKKKEEETRATPRGTSNTPKKTDSPAEEKKEDEEGVGMTPVKEKEKKEKEGEDTPPDPKALSLEQQKEEMEGIVSDILIRTRLVRLGKPDKDARPPEKTAIDALLLRANALIALKPDLIGVAQERNLLTTVTLPDGTELPPGSGIFHLKDSVADDTPYRIVYDADKKELKLETVNVSAAEDRSALLENAQKQGAEFGARLKDAKTEAAIAEIITEINAAMGKWPELSEDIHGPSFKDDQALRLSCFLNGIRGRTGEDADPLAKIPVKDPEGIYVIAYVGGKVTSVDTLEERRAIERQRLAMENAEQAGQDAAADIERASKVSPAELRAVVVKLQETHTALETKEEKETFLLACGAFTVEDGPICFVNGNFGWEKEETGCYALRKKTAGATTEFSLDKVEGDDASPYAEGKEFEAYLKEALDAETKGDADRLLDRTLLRVNNYLRKHESVPAEREMCLTAMELSQDRTRIVNGKHCRYRLFLKDGEVESEDITPEAEKRESTPEEKGTEASLVLETATTPEERTESLRALQATYDGLKTPEEKSSFLTGVHAVVHDGAATVFLEDPAPGPGRETVIRALRMDKGDTRFALSELSVDEKERYRQGTITEKAVKNAKTPKALTEAIDMANKYLEPLKPVQREAFLMAMKLGRGQPRSVRIAEGGYLLSFDAAKGVIVQKKLS